MRNDRKHEGLGDSLSCRANGQASEVGDVSGARLAAGSNLFDGSAKNSLLGSAESDSRRTHCGTVRLEPTGLLKKGVTSIAVQKVKHGKWNISGILCQSRKGRGTSSLNGLLGQ